MMRTTNPGYPAGGEKRGDEEGRSKETVVAGARAPGSAGGGFWGDATHISGSATLCAQPTRTA